MKKYQCSISIVIEAEDENEAMEIGSDAICRRIGEDYPENHIIVEEYND